MIVKLFVLFLLNIVVYSYRAAVVSSYGSCSLDDYSILSMKSLPYDIILFPEMGLSSQTPPEKISVNENPCLLHEESTKPTQYNISCLSRSLNVYIVIDIVEQGLPCTKGIDPDCHFDYYIHNTVIVFDRTGNIITRYRKINIYDPIFKAGSEMSYFATDFGVTFGVFICFDILFEYPSRELYKYGVTDYLFPTFWVDEFPLLSLQVQQAYSVQLGVNLLSANRLDRSSGSSIILDGDPLIVNTEKKNYVLVADVPIRNRSRLKNTYLEVTEVHERNKTFSFTIVFRFASCFDNLIKTSS